MTSIKPLNGTPAQQVTTSAGGTQQSAGAVTADIAAISAKALDRREDGFRIGEPPPGGRGEFPHMPPAGPPDGPGFGQETLDKCFSSMDALEKEMAGIDPTSPQGSKKMMDIERKLQRIDQLVTMITNMRRMVHEMNMQAIRSIVS